MVSLSACVVLFLLFVQSLAFPLIPTPTRSIALEASDLKPSLVLKARDDPDPDSTPTPTLANHLLFPYYICMGHNEDGVAYFQPDIRRAMQEAYRRHVENDLAYSMYDVNRTSGYPHRYFYNANWVGINQRANTNDLIEYPLVEGGVFRNGTDPGLDRVVMDAITGAFAGVLTHRGMPNNQLRPAAERNENVSFPRRAPLGAQQFGDLPWMAGFPKGPDEGGPAGQNAIEARSVTMAMGVPAEIAAS